MSAPALITRLSKAWHCAAGGYSAAMSLPKMLHLLKRWLTGFALCTATSAMAGESISIPDSAWQTWSPREEIAPIFRRDAEFGRTKAGSLNIETKGMPAAFGAWQTVVTNFTPGKTYRFEAWYRVAFVKDQRRSVVPRLQWLNARGQQVQPPIFAAGKLQPDKWYKVEYFAPAPLEATQLKIQLGFGFEYGGFVWFDDITLTEEPNPPKRVVRATSRSSAGSSTKPPRNSPTSSACRRASRRSARASATWKSANPCRDRRRNGWVNSPPNIAPGSSPACTSA
jgi:hypothetical protein